MKKRFFVLIICLLLMSSTAYADVVIENGNDFFSRYEKECVYLGREFSVNSSTGSVLVFDEPSSKNEIAKLENNEVVFVEFSCLYSGEFWGMTSFYPDDDYFQKKQGWVKIDGQLLVLYDYIAFEEDHLNEFYKCKGDFAEIKKTKSALAWAWPGADSPLWTIEDINTEYFQVSHAYKDSAGREWGFATYISGSPNVWFCLSDPLNQDIEKFNPAPAPYVWESETAHKDIGSSGNLTLVIILCLVAFLVIGTTILIKVFWKPNKTGGNKDE